MNQCGDCTLCCKLLGVRELAKPPMQWCQHCSIGVGCRIYERRPNECRNFDCLWLLNQTQDLLNELKPSECHVVLSDLQTEINKTLPGLEIDDRRIMLVYVDPDYPNAHKVGKMKEFLDELLSNGTELVIVNKGKKLLMKWGSVMDDEGLTS